MPPNGGCSPPQPTLAFERAGAVLKVAPVDDHGNLLIEEFTRLLSPKTKLVAATQVANALGTVNPVATIVKLAHRVGARVLIDGAQSVPHLAVNLAELDPDFFVFSGHKIFGPTGIGVVYIAERVWDETPAWQGGGNMIADVTIERAIYQGPPNKYEAGTGNIADAVGLAAALRYVNGIGIERIAAYEHSLLDYATPRLAAIPGVTLIGTADQKASVLSFVLGGHDPEEVGAFLNERGIAVRSGHHCAQPILRRLGVEKTVRPSFAFYNTHEEIGVFLRAVRDLAEGVDTKTHAVQYLHRSVGVRVRLRASARSGPGSAPHLEVDNPKGSSLTTSAGTTSTRPLSFDIGVHRRAPSPCRRIPSARF